MYVYMKVCMYVCTHTDIRNMTKIKRPLKTRVYLRSNYKLNRQRIYTLEPKREMEGSDSDRERPPYTDR